MTIKHDILINKRIIKIKKNKPTDTARRAFSTIPVSPFDFDLRDLS